MGGLLPPHLFGRPPCPMPYKAPCLLASCGLVDHVWSLPACCMQSMQADPPDTQMFRDHLAACRLMPFHLPPKTV